MNAKTHAIVDGLENPIYLQLPSGNIHDSRIATDLLSCVELTESIALAGKAYGSKQIRDYITQKNVFFNIPPKSNSKNPWKCYRWKYKERHLVECFFQKIKAFGRVSTRYDKLASCFFSLFLLAPSWF